MSAGPVGWYLAEQERIKRLKREWKYAGPERRNEIERELEEIAAARWSERNEGR